MPCQERMSGCITNSSKNGSSKGTGESNAPRTDGRSRVGPVRLLNFLNSCLETQSLLSPLMFTRQGAWTGWPQGLKHTRLFCLSPSPRVCPSSCPLNPWRHPTISSSVSLFSFCPQPFPASGSFPVSRLFASGGQSIGASVSALALPMSI